MQDHDFTAGPNRKNWAISGKYFKTGTCRKSKGSNKNYRQRKLLLDTCFFYYYFLFLGSFLRCQSFSVNARSQFLRSLLYLTGTIDVPNELFLIQEENEGISSAGINEPRPMILLNVRQQTSLWA